MKIVAHNYLHADADVDISDHDYVRFGDDPDRCIDIRVRDGVVEVSSCWSKIVVEPRAANVIQVKPS